MKQTLAAAGPTDLTHLGAGCALAGALTVAGLFASFLAFGPPGGQDQLQAIRPAAEYAQILLENPPARRLAIGLDNIFIVLYSTLFVVLAALLKQRLVYTRLTAAACGLLGLLGGLDLLENMHLLVMLSAAERGITISATQIQLQVWESLVKFHAGYVGLFMLGWSLPRNTLMEKVFCFALRWVQLPVGVLIYLTPDILAVPLLLVRTTFFLLALLALFVILRRWQSGSDVPV